VAETNVNDVNSLLLKGFKVAKEGQREDAYQIFCEVVNADPANEHGWLYRAATTDDLSEAYVCLQRVLSINPENSKAQRGLERIKARINEEDEQASDAATTPVAESEPPPAVTQPFQTIPKSDPPTASMKFSDSEVVSGFQFDERNNVYRVDQTAEPVSNINLPPVRPIPGPPIPPFGNIPPFQEPEPDNNVSEMFGRMDTQPRNTVPQAAPQSSFSQAQDVAADNFAPPPPTPSDFDALREEVRQPNKMSKRPKPELQTFGGGTSTQLGQVGEERRKRQRRSILVVLLLLAVIVLALLVLVVARRNDNSTQGSTDTTNAALTADTTAPSSTAVTVGDTTTPASTTSSSGTTTAAATLNTASGTTTVASNATTAAPTTAAGNPTTAAPTTNAGSASPVRPIIITVRSGDNLTTLARTYGTTIPAIVAANRDPAALDQRGPLIGGTAANPQIYANTRLVIPVSQPNFTGRAAILKEGETVQTIADRYKVNPADILKLSGLTVATDAKVGDPLLLP
jgi:LysM repeat protein